MLTLNIGITTITGVSLIDFGD